MTISSATRKAGPFLGNGVTAQFPFNFKCFTTSDLQVVKTSVSGVDGTLVLNSDYAIVLNSDQNNNPGGTILYPAVTGPFLATGEKLTAFGVLTEVQGTHLTNGGNFFASTIEDQMDYLTILAQQLREVISRAITSSPTDFPGSMSLGTAAERASKFLTFDSAGNLSLATTLPSGTLSAGVVGQLIWPQTGAEVSVPIVPSSFVFSAGRPIIEVERYGAKLDGVTDDSLALKNALLVASKVGGLVHIPASANFLKVDSAQLPIPILSNTGLIGDGMDCSKIVVTGSTIAHLFTGSNVTGFYASGVSFTGNGQGTTIAQSSAFSFQGDTSAAATLGDYCIERCRFTNFTAAYWVWFRNQAVNFNMDNIWVRNCVFQGQNGNAIGPSSVGPSSYFVSFEGLNNYSGVGNVGLVRNCWVENCWADANFVKGFGVAWESTQNVYFTRNVILNAGQANSNDAANYAFLVYNNGGVSSSPDPDIVYIENNVVIAPRDCGVYSAMHGIGGSRVFVRGNFFSGQNSTATGTLPKGAVALNGPLTSVVENNVIDSCYWGITVIGQYVSQTARIRGNRVTSALANGQSIYVQSTLTGSMLRAEVTENYVSTGNANARAVYVDVTSTAGIADVVVERNFLASAFECVEVSSRSGVALLGTISISDNEILGSSATGGGIVAASLTNANGRTTIKGNRFTGTWGNVALLQITSSVNLTVVGNQFYDINGASQYCITANGAHGRLEGNRFINVTNAQVIFISGGEDLGRSTPTWTGANNDFIENLIPVEAGSASSKYVIIGWRWDTTGAAWRQQRCLTGN